MRHVFDLIEQWLEAPQVVLDGMELLLLTLLLVLMVLVFYKADKERREGEQGRPRDLDR